MFNGNTKQGLNKMTRNKTARKVTPWQAKQKLERIENTIMAISASFGFVLLLSFPYFVQYFN
jgi:hypothetical protein